MRRVLYWLCNDDTTDDGEALLLFFLLKSEMKSYLCCFQTSFHVVIDLLKNKHFRWQRRVIDLSHISYRDSHSAIVFPASLSSGEFEQQNINCAATFGNR